MVQDCIILHTLYATLHTPHSILDTQYCASKFRHFPPFSPAVNDFPSFSFTALLTAHFTLFTLYPLHRSPNHLQLQSFLNITSHPLANSLVPNPNERGTPLSFGVPPFSSVFHLLWTIFLSFSVVLFLPFSWHSSIFLHFPLVFNDFPSFFSYLFPVIPPLSSIFPPVSTIFLPFLTFFSYLAFLHFPLFSTIFLRFFPTFFLSFLHFPPFSPCFQRFSFIFLGFFLPFPAGVNGPRGNRSLP